MAKIPIAERAQPSLSKENKEEIEVMRSLEAMVNTEGWRNFVKILSAARLGYHNDILGKSSGIESLFGAEFAKGAVNAITYAIELPNAMINNVKDNILGKEKAEE